MIEDEKKLFKLFLFWLNFMDVDSRLGWDGKGFGGMDKGGKERNGKGWDGKEWNGKRW